MGTNTIPTASPNTVIPASHHNNLKDAMTGDVVPRSPSSTSPEDNLHSLGQSGYRWLQGFIKKVFIGSVADNISIESQAGDCIIKVGGTERVRIPQAVSLLPSGMIMSYAGTADISTQWLICDGRELSRTTYAALFAAIGVTFGQGNNTTTFNIPDLRGRFLRGRDAGTGRDPDAASRTAIMTGGVTGDNVGSLQGFATGAHTHGNVALLGSPRNKSTSTTAGESVADGSCNNSTGNQTDANTGSETRPINVNVNFIIKT